MGPREAGSGAVGPSRAESGRLGLSGVGEGLDMHWEILYFTVRLGPGYKDRFGRSGPSRAE